MKQVIQSYKTGELCIVDVPPPALKPGCVLVRKRLVGNTLVQTDLRKLDVCGQEMH